ncbi:hypothetical protein [Spirosoma validum]|uniref:Uncharacterized protein n=1 Tax=Spirosoma validum TaxID=2771355 RepID=A0A927B257_9BACT|nr:hypothetical protein [Spirosoma validum]MBD2753989.1 hypothetical protein [Spirosoma validum]
MERTITPIDANRPETSTYPSLQVLLSQSEDGFYGSLQRIWNNVIQLEDMGIIQQENDKFVYAYRFAELELQRAFAIQATADTIDQLH